MTNQSSNRQIFHLQAPASQLAIIFHKNIYFLSFLLAFSQNIVLQGKDSLLETKHRTEQNQVPMTFTFSVVFFFSIKHSQRAVRYQYLSYYVMTHSSLIDLNWKKKRIRENAMCAKLNFYFFYKNIVYQYLFVYIVIA